MIEVKWKYSTATNINTILPRLPILADPPRPTYAVCANFITLSENLSIDFSGYDESLTYRWEQISGGLVNINDPNTLNATIDLIGHPPDDRLFRLIVNEGRTNQIELIAPVFSRIISTTSPSLSSVKSNENIGIYSGSENIRTAIFSPPNETYSSCSSVGIEYLDVGINLSEPSSVHSIYLQVWDTATKQWVDDQLGSAQFASHRFVILQGFSYRLKILWKRSDNSPTTFTYYSDPIKYSGSFEGLPIVSSKGGHFSINGIQANSVTGWDIERIRRSRKILEEPEQTDDPVGGFIISSVSRASGVTLSRISRRRTIQDDPQQTDDPVGGFIISSSINYQVFDIERVSGINISV